MNKNRNWKTASVTLLVVIATVVCVLIGVGLYGKFANQQLFDVVWKYNYAMMRMPDGSIVQGKLNSWKDFSNSDTVQLKINGKTYLTHYENVVMIAD